MKSSRLALLFVFTALLSACNFSLAADVTPPPGYQPPPTQPPTAEATIPPVYPLVPPDPKNGATIFAEKCAPCHGAAALGNGPSASNLPFAVAAIGAPDVSLPAVPARWFTTITQGNLERRMPPFQSLSDRQRWDVLAYVLSLSTPPDTVAQGASLFQANCIRCHGQSGKGDGPDAANLNMPDFTNQEFMAGKSAQDFYKGVVQGSPKGMPAFNTQLSQTDVWSLSAYVRSLSFAHTAVAAAAPVSSGTPYPVQVTPLSEVISTASVTQTNTLTVTGSLTNSVGTITGVVMNASGGSIPADMEVMLHAFDQMSVAFTETAKIQDGGKFAFNNIDMPAGRSFLATVDYRGVVYGSQIISADKGSTSIDMPIQVYESTIDTGALSVDRLHYFFEFLDTKTVRIVELYVISNNGSQTIVAAKQGQPVITFTLPQGAANLQFQDGALGKRYLATKDGFGDTIPIRPGAGSYQVMYTYEMAYDQKLDFTRPVGMPVNAVVVLVPEGGVQVKSASLTDAGTRDVQGSSYHMYTGNSLSQGDQLSMTITGQPSAKAASTPRASSTQGLLIGAGALGVALLLAGLWLYRRTLATEKTAAGPSASQPAAPASENAETVMDAILAVDDLYQDGQLPEEAYLKRRAELKARLKDLMGS